MSKTPEELIKSAVSHIRMALPADSTLPTHARMVISGLIDILEVSLKTQQENAQRLETIMYSLQHMEAQLINR